MKRKKEVNSIEIPNTIQLEKELKREQFKSKYKSILKSTIYSLIIVCALSVLFATLIFPVFQISGTSMEPILAKDDISVAMKSKEFERGEIIAFYHNNRILIKRVIAKSSEWVHIDENGNVYINNELIDEPYVKEKFLGETDIEYPYQVPEGTYFVLGDKRETSIDSRNSNIGCISTDNIIGKIVLTVWPIKRFKIIK